MKWLLWIATIALSGCQFYGKIDDPKTSLNSHYLLGKTGGDYPIESLFEQMNDPILNELLKMGIENNLDLKIASMRTQEAKAKYGIAKSKLWPQLEFEADVQRLKYSGQGAETISLFGTTSVPSSNGAITDLYFTAFDAAWEIDLFGKLLSEKSAAFFEVKSIEELARDVYVSLQAEIADAYFELRSNQEQLTVLFDHEKSRLETVHLMQVRYDAGLATAVDVDRAEAEYRELQSQIPLVDSEYARSLNRLCVLLAKEPGELDEMIDGVQSRDPGMFNLEIVSDLLRRRPDVRSAENEYIRSQHLTRSAKADLFPRFSLTGSFGFSSFNTSDLFTTKNMQWSIGPAVRWPIFKGWEILSNIDRTKSIQSQAALNYHNTVLTALSEVENALVVYANQHERDTSLEKAVEALTLAHESTWDLYVAGLSDFNAVLDVQRTYLESERNRITSEAMTLKALIMIYKSVGGSW